MISLAKSWLHNFHEMLYFTKRALKTLYVAFLRNESKHINYSMLNAFFYVYNEIFIKLNDS